MLANLGVMQTERKPRTRKVKSIGKPFAAVDISGNPYALCREYQDCIPVIYGNIYALASELTSGLTAEQRTYALESRRPNRFKDGRAFEIRFRSKEGQPIGGSIQIRDTKGRVVTIRDAKSFFCLSWDQMKRRYGTEDLAVIMERTRSSLAAVELKADSGNWQLCSSIPTYLWNKLEKNGQVSLRVGQIGAKKRELGNLQGYRVFGHTDDPVYIYDIHGAYLSEMAKFPTLKPFSDSLWSARKTLGSDPASWIVKLASTIIPGKFTSQLPHNKYYRPILGKYIYQQVNQRLRDAMSLVSDPKNVYRWCVDGFISSENIENRLDDVGYGLGQWKPVERHEGLSIIQTNVWWTDRDHKDGGYRGIREKQVLENPFEVHTNRAIFDWDMMREKLEPATIYQNHYEGSCRGCQGGGTLHDRVNKNVIMIREEDL